jgi:tetratricopeptide (TPR) repeat protein
MSYRMSLITATLCLALLCQGSALGQTTAAAATPTAVSAALPPELIELRREGNAAAYNLDYAAARAKFEELRKRLPQHPAGDLYLATVIWLEQLYHSRRLQTSLYRDESSFYAGADKAKEETEGDPVDQAVDRAFRDRMAQAKAKALALVNRNKKDPDALYFLGAVYGVLAGYEASTARKFFAAMRNGSRSVDLHRQVIKLKPDYHDAYLSIGMYDYIVGSLPFPLKALAAIGGIRGSKSRGIQELRQVIEQGAQTADDARVMLIAIYQNEKRPEEALTLLQQLTQKYPRSYLLKLETASTLVQLRRAEEAYAIFEGLLKAEDSRQAVDLIRYQYAEARAANDEHERAAEQFLLAARAPKAEPQLATYSLLRAGQVYDLAGKRQEAITQYQEVLARPNVYDTREQAERGLKRPFRDKDKKRETEE